MQAARDTILIVEDDGDWRSLMEEALQRSGVRAKIEMEATEEAALAIIKERADQLLAVIADLSLVGAVGNEGDRIAQAALDTGVPKVATITGSTRTSKIVPTFSKREDADEKIARLLNAA